MLRLKDVLHTDICIAGAGVIGLSLALELHARNLSVTVVEAGQPLREASWAAAGMLAARDPHNPAELSALSELSVSLYSEFLERLKALSGVGVPFQTSQTLQAAGAFHASTPASALDMITAPLSLPSGFDLLNEHSIDPRQLASSLRAAIAATSIRLLTESPIISTYPKSGHPNSAHSNSAHSKSGSIRIATPTNAIEAAHFIDCTGAWANDPAFKVVPIKGQMLAVALPSDLRLQAVVRTDALYIVPRTIGPNAGQAIIGATIEDVGFDKSIHLSQIEELRLQAIALLPGLAHARIADSWCGLRPATPDRLPILGAHPSRRNHWIATGHYRNGILLAPATARVMAQTLLNQSTDVSLDRFAPSRLAVRDAVQL